MGQGGNRYDSGEFDGNFGSNSQASAVSFNRVQHEMANSNGHLNNVNRYEFTNRNYERNVSTEFDERFEENGFYGSTPEPTTLKGENRFVGKILSSCAPYSYSDAISTEYTQGNFFVDN